MTGEPHGAGDDDGDAVSRNAFVVLQDKYVHARRLSCCPTMDLIAVLTVDGQLIVHRTVSWQKLLHVKSSEVSFEITAIEWSPDGLFLALGCDEGEVVVYAIESGEQRPELRGLKTLHAFQHRHAITAMHWVRQQESIRASRAERVAESYFGHRAKRLLQNPSHGSDAASKTQTATVLATADAKGEIVLWWMGKVYVTKIDVAAQITRLQGETNSSAAKSTFTIDAVRLAPDLSRLFVMLVTPSEKQTSGVSSGMGGDAATEGSNRKTAGKSHQLLTLNLSSVHQIREEIELMACVADESHHILNQLVLTMRQMTTEWKNATRIFELKMGLIGSLYEKYACDDPPQVDMLSVVASGITSPALAQYFAQDIQEMSVDRMQKLLLSGCQTLASLIEDRMKAGLVQLLFHLSELRGRAKWKRSAYADILGITMSCLDELIQLAQDFLISMEVFSQAVHETRQDFVLFFQWILERIRIHTNATTGRGGASAVSSATNGDAGKSLLDQRRLCGFLQRAAQAAQEFRKEQSPSNKYRVEATFGNLVSKQLSKPKTSSESASAESSAELLEKLESKWFAMMQRVSQSIASTVTVDTTSCLNFGETVDEYSFHFRQASERLDHGRDGDDEVDEESEDEDDEDEMEAVDWQSLKRFASAQSSGAKHSLMMLGMQCEGNALIVLRASWNHPSHEQLQSGLVWEAVKLTTSTETRASSSHLRGFHFYGDEASGKKEQLAFLVATRQAAEEGEEEDSKQVGQDWLYLQPYDQLARTPVEEILSTQSTSNRLELSRLPICLLPSGKYRARMVTQSSSSMVTSSLPRVIANAQRGIVCVSTPPNRLTVLDAEDDDGDEEEVQQRDSGHLKGHESDSNEVDL